jgi:hypothetical protein
MMMLCVCIVVLLVLLLLALFIRLLAFYEMVSSPSLVCLRKSQNVSSFVSPMSRELPRRFLPTGVRRQRNPIDSYAVAGYTGSGGDR